MPEKALRYNEVKPQLSYLFEAPLAMEGLVERFKLGTEKYSRSNWKNGFDDLTLIDSLLRHLSKFQNGEGEDLKDGGHHVDAILWNAVVLAEQYHKRRLSIG